MRHRCRGGHGNLRRRGFFLFRNDLDTRQKRLLPPPDYAGQVNPGPFQPTPDTPNEGEPYLVVRQTPCVAAVILFLLLPVSCAPTAERSGAGPEIKAGQNAPLAAYTPSALSRIYAFTCADGFSFTASIEKTNARLFLADRSVFLPHRPSLSGGRYSSDGTDLLFAGSEARLELDGRVHRDCKNNRGRAIWERARLSGADFRAVGNEPGWTLEIYRGDKILLVADTGSTRSVFPFTAPKTGAGGSIRYVTTADGRALEVLVDRRPCADTMSGERFDHAVTVFFQDRTLSGCGRRLP